MCISWTPDYLLMYKGQGQDLKNFVFDFYITFLFLIIFFIRCWSDIVCLRFWTFSIIVTTTSLIGILISLCVIVNTYVLLHLYNIIGALNISLTILTWVRFSTRVSGTYLWLFLFNPQFVTSLTLSSSPNRSGSHDVTEKV
jgi:hypothetical protein